MQDKKNGSNLEVLIERVEQWRRTRKHARSVMPEEFWQQAIVEAKRESVSKVAKALNLSSSKLSKKMGIRRKRSKSTPESSQFVQLSSGAEKCKSAKSFEYRAPSGGVIRIEF